jgi:hypothetical protein
MWPTKIRKRTPGEVPPRPKVDSQTAASLAIQRALTNAKEVDECPIIHEYNGDVRISTRIWPPCKTMADAQSKPAARSVQKAPSALPAKRFGPDRWLIDTGSGHDLVGRRDVSAAVLRTTRPARCPLVLCTANGDAEANKEVDVPVQSLGGSVSPLLLDSTPPVLSVGRRCMKEGWAFRWDAGQRPVFTDPAGMQHELEVQGDSLNLLEPWAEGYTPPVAALSAPDVAPPPPPAPPPQLALEDGPAGEGAPAAEEASDEEAAELTLREQAVSLEHLLTHRIKNKYCPTCVRAKLHAKPARAKGQNHNPDEAPKAFGDQITADHIIVSEEDKGRGGGGQPSR